MLLIVIIVWTSNPTVHEEFKKCIALC
jgi:hypothetical protein